MPETFPAQGPVSYSQLRGGLFVYGFPVELEIRQVGPEIRRNGSFQRQFVFSTMEEVIELLEETPKEGNVFYYRRISREEYGRLREENAVKKYEV